MMFKILRWMAVNLLVCVLLLLLLEGIAGFAAAFQTFQNQESPVSSHGEVAERRHTEYDPLLGWINLPGLTISNMYGPGRHLRVNRQRFRMNRDLASDPAARVRMVLSGDSFTFGYGVGNKSTWGRVLEQMVDGLEVVNMGQGGYGLGQAYLWYARDGVGLPHDIHVMAFITEDYRRMARPRFMGYGKPVLTTRDDQLRVDNTPVPRHRAGEEPWAPLMPALGNLRMVEWAMLRAERHAEQRDRQWRARIQDTAARMFDELMRMHAAAGRLGVLVHLPVQDDFYDDDSDSWRAWLRAEADRHGWPFIDLVEDFRQLPPDQVRALFIQSDSGRYRGAKGHYTEQGNQQVAEALHARLARHPALAGRLGI